MEIVSGKYNPRRMRLEGLDALVDAQFGEYETNVLCLEKVMEQSWTCDQKRDLWHCYKVSSQHRNALIEKVMSNQRVTRIERCHYCGINSISSIDHYLPKEVFPEFSVMALNLVPCCLECNNLKGSAHRGTEGLSTLSIYFDVMPVEQCLFVELKWSDPGRFPRAVYALENVQKINDRLYARIESHFEILELFDRYSRASVQVMSEVVSTMRKVGRSLSKDEIMAFLVAEVDSLIGLYSVNYWDAILRRVLMSDDRFWEFAQCGG
jgi:hypothetical protein